ncbi:MAG TPA: DUF4157 domain-containing protein [Kofleriaceae bacterium]|jgi:hypothetical protein|nr:DUF4157 domain-containing protein [Kofleriaceae bacterium]
MTSAREQFNGPESTESAPQHRDTGAVGKHTLTQDVFAEPALTGVGKRTLTEQVQRKLGTAAAAHAPMSVADAAGHGTSGASGPLPHGDTIQRLFGRHDISGISAHTDGAASEGARAMGAQAFATGDRVAFDGTPDLHTAAHEASHVVQQRAGVSLKGGVGAEGDAYEQHADAVADQVVAGRSAEGLLDRFAPAGGGSAGAVQRKLGVGHTSGKMRQISTGRTGTITGKAVWGKYPVRWDDDGKTTQVDANDADYDLVVSSTPTVTSPTPTTPTPTVTSPTPTTPPPTVTTPTPTTATPTTAVATGGKQPDRDLSHFTTTRTSRRSGRTSRTRSTTRCKPSCLAFKRSTRPPRSASAAASRPA